MADRTSRLAVDRGIQGENAELVSPDRIVAIPGADQFRQVCAGSTDVDRPLGPGLSLHRAKPTKPSGRRQNSHKRSHDASPTSVLIAMSALGTWNER